jgi:hypothetical protein
VTLAEAMKILQQYQLRLTPQAVEFFVPLPEAGDEDRNAKVLEPRLKKFDFISFLLSRDGFKEIFKRRETKDRLWKETQSKIEGFINSGNYKKERDLDF